MTSFINSLGHTVIGSSSNARDALALCHDNNPNLAILDLDLGAGPTGIDLAHGLRRLIPNLSIIMLTSYDDPRLLRFAKFDLPNGTIYLGKKDIADEEVISQAISVAMMQTDNLTERAKSPRPIFGLKNLSDSQIEIMRLVASGLSNAKIAEVQCVSEAAIGKTISRLIRRLDISAEQDQNQRVLIAQAYFNATSMGSK